MARYSKDSDSSKHSQFYFKGAGISRTEQKEINQMLGRGIVGICAFPMIAGILIRLTLNYQSSEQVAASQIQSEKAAYQNQITQTVNSCNSVLDALNLHEQFGSVGISSDEYVDRQLKLIRLKDVYCR